jgi:cysteinyl-tRNA synthetase
VQQSQSAIERLEEFLLRFETDTFREGVNERVEEACRTAHDKFVAGMDDDLNTAGALGAVFEFVRQGNTAMGEGSLRQGNAASIRSLFDDFQAIFPVLKDPTHQILDSQIEALIAERNQARRERNFKKADEIRDQLLAQGIILEDTRAGLRWKRKE